MTLTPKTERTFKKVAVKDMSLIAKEPDIPDSATVFIMGDLPTTTVSVRISWFSDGSGSDGDSIKTLSLGGDVTTYKEFKDKYNND